MVQPRSWKLDETGQFGIKLSLQLRKEAVRRLHVGQMKLRAYKFRGTREAVYIAIARHSVSLSGCGNITTTQVSAQPIYGLVVRVTITILE